MTGTADLVAGLIDTLGTAYPTRLVDRANLPGRVVCVVAPRRWEYDTAAMCTPIPVQVTADVLVVAGMTGERGTADLLGHLDPVAELVRLAGWTVTDCEADNVGDAPALVLTATAQGEG